MEAIFIQNDKGKWRWIIPREGPDVTPLNRFDTKEAATLDFLHLQRRLAMPWVEQRDECKQEVSDLHIELDDAYKRLRLGINARQRYQRWLLVLAIALISQALYVVTLLR